MVVVMFCAVPYLRVLKFACPGKTTAERMLAMSRHSVAIQSGATLPLRRDDYEINSWEQFTFGVVSEGFLWKVC